MKFSCYIHILLIILFAAEVEVMMEQYIEDTGIDAHLVHLYEPADENATQGAEEGNAQRVKVKRAPWGILATNEAGVVVLFE